MIGIELGYVCHMIGISCDTDLGYYPLAINHCWPIPELDGSLELGTLGSKMGCPLCNLTACY
jgi:hypothetical protein